MGFNDRIDHPEEYGQQYARDVDHEEVVTGRTQDEIKARIKQVPLHEAALLFAFLHPENRRASIGFDVENWVGGESLSTADLGTMLFDLVSKRNSADTDLIRSITKHRIRAVLWMLNYPPQSVFNACGYRVMGK